MGRTVNAVLSLLYRCCVLLTGLFAETSLILHQNTLADTTAVLCHVGSGDNCSSVVILKLYF